MVVEVSGSWASRVAGIGGCIRWLHYAGQLQDQTEAMCANGQGVGIDDCLDSVSRRPRGLLGKLFHLSDHY
ncbi:hypothetical protein KL938_001718 [Ogataea parapolymorpha]|nr:hypothetical protein KL938_001718 [Ogataea parapolymorpha]